MRPGKPVDRRVALDMRLARPRRLVHGPAGRAARHRHAGLRCALQHKVVRVLRVRRCGAVAQQMTPQNIQELVLQQAVDAGPVLARLPRELDELAQTLLHGELRTRLSLLSEPEDVRVARSMVNRLVTGLIGSALALSSSVLLVAPSSPGPSGLGLINILGGIGLFFSVLLLLRLVVQILRERD